MIKYGGFWTSLPMALILVEPIVHFGDLYWTEMEALSNHKLHDNHPPIQSLVIKRDPAM